MAQLVLPGVHDLGNVEGPGADGVLVGTLASTALSKGLLSGRAEACLCYTDDGGLYADETTDANDADADDVPALPATPADDDALYIGHATKQFADARITIGTAGDGTWTITWQYWDGSAWQALANVTDGTTGFEAAAGTVALTFDLPEDWAQNTVDSVLGYWIRGVVSGYSAVTTQPLLTRIYIVVDADDPTWTDDTTDINDADAGDVALLPSFPVLHDAFYYGHATEKFCKIMLTTSQARTGTATLTWEYWDGASWASIEDIDDDTIGYSETAGALVVSFVPPSDWTANTAGNGPNGQAGYFVRCRLSAITSVTQQPLATRAYVKPLVTGADGVTAPSTTTITAIDCFAGTPSGSTADSIFLLVNVTTGLFASFTWTKADAMDRITGLSLAVSAGDKLAIVQITEDGTTEFADATFIPS